MPPWRVFSISMITLGLALVLALLSAAASEMGSVWLTATSALLALLLAGWVGVAMVPRLARRTSLRWLAWQVDYRLTRAGIAYIVLVVLLALTSVNTGNNLLFMILACLLAALLVSGVLSRIVLLGVTFKFELPEHIFARQPLLATIELSNQKEFWPSFSLLVGSKSSGSRPGILTRPVYFPFVPRRTSLRQKVELLFPRRGVYAQDELSLSTRFPFGFLEKTRRFPSPLEILVYPEIESAEEFFGVLPLLSGEMSSFYRGRGYELHSLREYTSMDSVRLMDWKSSARSGSLMVREFTREDEWRVLLVMDSLLPEHASLAPDSPEAEWFERAIGLAASLAWHFHETDAVLGYRSRQFAAPLSRAGEIIYDVLRDLALLTPASGANEEDLFASLATDPGVFKIVFTGRARGSIPTSLWTSSYFIFIDSLAAPESASVTALVPASV
jgi:uncharacterized protein (DUF58 family)